MAFFYWNKYFEVGIPSIDQQHQRLVDLINELAAAITEGEKLPDVRSLISRLNEYAANHFSEEETLLAAAPLTEEEKDRHRKAHRGFVDKVREIEGRPDLLRAEVAEQVLEFLTTWLISHILSADKKLVQAMEIKGAGITEPPRLFKVSLVERTLLGALTETERRFRLISDHTPALIWVADANGVRGFFNRSWQDFVGTDLDSPETGWIDHIHPEDREAYLAIIDKLPQAPQPVEVEYRLRKHDGQYHWFLEKILPRLDARNTFLGLIAAAIDISSVKQAEMLLSHANEELEKEVARRTEQLEKLMLTDSLTGVGNRRLLIKSLDEEIMRAQRYQRPLSIVFFDLDHFKQVNDTYGHAVGDRVLVGVADRLKDCLRECDHLGRIGGEEFVVLLPETCLVDALLVAERMRNNVAQMQIPQIKEKITVSAGVAERRANESGDDLLRRGDRALYHAKDAGRNCCLADSDNT